MLRSEVIENDEQSYSSFYLEEVEGSIFCRFKKQVNLHGERIAAIDQSHRLTYRELNAAAKRVGRVVRSHNCSQTNPVAILCGLRTPAIGAILGVLEVGSFYVPIDPTIPKPRILALLTDSTARLLLTDNDHEQLAKRIAPPAVCVVNVEGLKQKENASNQVASDERDVLSMADRNGKVDSLPDDLAYVIYTSGSTGRPKGVMQTHRNVLFDIRRQAFDLETTPCDRFGLIFPIAFSASICHIFGALLNGAAVCLFDLKTHGLKQLAQWLVAQKITILDINVATFRALAATLSPNDKFPSMRMVAPGSEPVYKSEFEIFKRHFPLGCRMQNALGTTETRTITQILVNHDYEMNDEFVPIGWPIDNKEIQLLHENGELVPDGQPGQIVVRSRYLSPGYWRSPIETARVFRPDPHDERLRLYFTGDLARRSADGCLTHLGRLDSQVKIRGNRVEVGEVESTMARVAGVDDAAVVAQTDEHGITRLIGFAAGKSETRPDAKQLRKAMQQDLPRFMIPSRFVQLDKMPVNANGKLDRVALHRLAETTDREVEHFAEPQTPTEIRLHEIWKNVIRIPNFGIDEDFFDLGGDSLGAMRVCAEIEISFDRFIPLVSLSDCATIRNLAAKLDGEPDLPADQGPVLLQSQSGSATPVFCVPGIGGHAASYRPLLEKLDSRRTAYGLQYPGLDGLSLPLDSVESLASHFIVMMRRLQPEGPYRLIGYSLGGLIIYEMARQLKVAGANCEWIFLLDTLAPGGSRRRNFAFRMMGHVRKQYSMRGTERILYILDCLKQRFHGFDKTAGSTGQEFGDDIRGTKLVSAIESVRSACKKARQRYNPKPFHGHVTLFRCIEQTADPAFEIVDDDLGWSRLALGGVQTVPIPGEHLSIFSEPHVGSLAEKMRSIATEKSTSQPSDRER